MLYVLYTISDICWNENERRPIGGFEHTEKGILRFTHILQIYIYEYCPQSGHDKEAVS